MAIARQRGELIEKSLVSRQAQYIFITLRQAILNFPTLYARRVVGIADEHQAKQILTKATHEFLTELSQFFREVRSIPIGWKPSKPIVASEAASHSPIKRPGDQGRASQGEDSPEKKTRPCGNCAPSGRSLDPFWRTRAGI